MACDYVRAVRLLNATSVALMNGMQAFCFSGEDDGMLALVDVSKSTH